MAYMYGGYPIARHTYLTHVKLCWAITPLLHAEKFGTSFAIIKADIGGNIDRLETARGKDPEKYEELFAIVLDEVERGEQSGKYSDTKALLWLKRQATCNMWP